MKMDNKNNMAGQSSMPSAKGQGCLFDVYPLFDINIVKGKGCKVWDEQGTEYLDLYGGHAVISIGHCHPHYVEAVSRQVSQLGLYSNSVVNKLQQHFEK